MSNQPGGPDLHYRRLPGWLRRHFSWLWPQACFVCGGESAHAVCAACQLSLPVASPLHCPVCALPTALGETCGRCLRRLPAFDASRAVFAYASPVREMILALKHGQGFMLLPMMSEALACAIEGLEADCIVAMPLHERRVIERGYNQSVELARLLSRVSGWPLLLERVRRDVDTPLLAGLRVRDRRRAVRGAFRCVESFAGRRVLVVDDVMTSGATLNELARTLKLAGAARVSNLVLARAERAGRQ